MFFNVRGYISGEWQNLNWIVRSSIRQRYPYRRDCESYLWYYQASRFDYMRIDASPTWCCEGRIRTLHRDVFMSCMAMCVYPLQFMTSLTDEDYSHSPRNAGWVHFRLEWLTQLFILIDLSDYAITNKLTPFISMQNHYNLVYREEEREMMPTLKYYGVGCIPWSPLARGYVTRPLKDHSQTQRGGTDRCFFRAVSGFPE